MVSDQPHIFISVAEPSADLHAASLIKAVKDLHPGARFSGIAGPRMRAAGCDCIYDMTAHSSMLIAALGHLHHAVQMYRLSTQALREQRYDAAVVVDSPILNIWIARYAHLMNTPVMYYIAPQRWAWIGSARISHMRAWVDRIACILPFEEPYYRSFDIDATYVGHPLFASLAARSIDRELVAKLKQGADRVLTLMPGSRKHVAAENFGGQLKVAKALSERFGNLKVLVSVANSQVRPVLEQFSKGVDLNIEMHEGQNAELLEAADLALVVSGTATLEAAFHNTPMIVMYNSSMMYHLIRWIICTRYFSLPNILAGRELVPEFMPYYTSTKPIAQRALELLSSDEKRQGMRADLAQLVAPFLNTSASDTTAKILLDLINFKPQATETSSDVVLPRSATEGTSVVAST